MSRPERSGVGATAGTADEPFVARLLARSTFPPAGSRLPCAVSGGADSAALLVLAVAAGCRALALHVDHGLREASGEEAAEVRALAARFGADFRPLAVTVGPGPNLEARARAARLGVLPAGTAFGHTADDQAETMLANLMRGAGVEGLAAMRPGARHPILRLRRWETLELCRRLGIVPVHDPGNDDGRFLRNRVRRELLPLLAELSGRDPVPVLERQAGHLREVADLLQEQAGAIDPTDARAVAAAPGPVAAAALRTWLRPHCGGHPPDTAALGRVMQVVRGERRATEIAGGVRVSRRGGRLRLEPTAGPIAADGGGAAGPAGPGR